METLASVARPVEVQGVKEITKGQSHLVYSEIKTVLTNKTPGEKQLSVFKKQAGAEEPQKEVGNFCLGKREIK